MSKYFIYVGSDGLYAEGASTYESTDFINVSAGAGDAGKPVVLDAAGHIDATMINDGDIDHGDLAAGSLGDDDHSQYHNDTRGDARYYTQTILGSTTVSEGASLIGVQDANGYFTGDDQEAINNELFEAIGQPGVTYVADEAISKGDALYVSANDNVSIYSDLAVSERVMGLAYADAIDTAAVKSCSNDIVITGLLTTATAGDAYYWTGSAHSSTIPAANGAYVWQTGVAKNATDLHVQIMKVKKNKAA